MGENVQASVVLYTSRWCGYCHAAKRLLTGLDVAFEEVSVEGRHDIREWLVTASGQHTVPQIFINRQSIGGYSELAELHRADGLLSLLAQPETANPSDAVLPR